MVNQKQLKYLLEDVIALGLEVNVPEFSISSGEILLGEEGSLYREPLFSFNVPNLSEVDLTFLDEVLKAIEEAGDNVDSLRKVFNIDYEQSVNYLKLVHFFVSEAYLDNEYPLDKHDRVSFQAVKEEYRKYLAVPIVDILIDRFYSELKVSVKKTRKVFFTCDFDILNFWSELGKKGVIKREMKSLAKFQLKRTYSEAKSIVKGSKAVKYNYFLNDEMFQYETNTAVEIENIAFWLIQKNHPLDCENDFSNPAVKSFIEELKNRDVVFGLHPNYESAANDIVFEEQINKFKSVFGSAPEKNRFHYLHCRSPL